MSHLARMFELKRDKLNVRQGVTVEVVLVVLAAAAIALGQQKYLLPVVLGVLFVALIDPGGEYGYRVRTMTVFALTGALLTALGFGIGGGPWGYAVLAAFVVTLLAGLAVKFGLHRFVAGMLLNFWFILALAQPSLYNLDRVQADTWQHTLAWLVGCALWIAVSGVVWLARGRGPRPAPAEAIPGDTAAHELTPPLILFALIRALAVSIAVAVAFGLNLPNASWMPLAALVTMKPSWDQSVLAAEQRLAGAILGAALSALVLLTIDNKIVTVAIIVVLGAVSVSISGVNYALSTAATAAAILIAMDLPHPSNFADERMRVVYTFAGVGIAVAITFLADQLQKHTKPRTPQPT